MRWIGTNRIWFFSVRKRIEGRSAASSVPMKAPLPSASTRTLFPIISRSASFIPFIPFLPAPRSLHGSVREADLPESNADSGVELRGPRKANAAPTGHCLNLLRLAARGALGEGTIAAGLAVDEGPIRQ